MLSRLLFAALLALVPSLALAQASPTGPFTPGHALVAVTPTGSLFADAGGAAGSSIFGRGYLTEIGITNTGTPFCIYDALTNGAYHSLCLGANSLGGALLSYSANNGAAPLPLSFVINGSTFAFPGSANVVGPASSTVGDIACWGNTGGTLLRDGSSNPCTANTLSVTTQLNVSGAFTATGLVTNSDLVNPVTTVNGTACTLGQSCTVSTSASTITDGSTTIASGATNTVLINSGGVLSHLATANNALYVTSGGGVPSISTTMPSGITAPGLVLTGTTAAATLGVSGTGSITPVVGTLIVTGNAPSYPNLVPTGTGTAIIANTAADGLVLQGYGNGNNITVLDQTAAHRICVVQNGSESWSCNAIDVYNNNVGGPPEVGIYAPAPDVLGLAANTTLVAQFTTTGMNSTAVGATTRGTGAFTTLSANNTTTLTGALNASGASTFSNSLSATGTSTFSGTLISASGTFPATFANGTLALVGSTTAFPTFGGDVAKGAVFTNNAGGLQLEGQGSALDVSINNKVNSPALAVPTGTLDIKSYGHIRAGGANPPVLTACGTNPSISGDDKAGLVTMGTGSPTGCVVTFATAYTSAPYCVVTWQATPLASQSYSISNTAITLTQTATSSNNVNYMCMGQSGG